MAKQERHTTITQRMLGLFIGSVAVFLFLALVSFSHTDPGFTHSVHAETISNWMGRVGAYSADALLLVIGLSAFLIPLFLVEYAWRCWHPARGVNWLNITATTVIFFVLVSFLGVVFPGEIPLFGSSMDAGGIVGALIGGALRSYLNTWGALIILLTLFVAAVMLGYDVQAAWNRIGAFIARRREAARAEKKPAAPKRTGKKSKSPKKDKKAAKAPKTDEPGITIVKHRDEDVTEIPVQTTMGFVEDYQLPAISLLNVPENKTRPITSKELKANAELITSKLADFGVRGEILEIKPGPVITMYEFTPAPGIKINKIVSLADDLAMALKASPVRVVAPIPNKNAVGIEIPNRSRETVPLRKIIASKEFVSSSSPLTLALGTDIEGCPVVTDLAKMPHLLIAGATGTGKSVGLNTMILSLIYRCDPSEIKFIMIDPKRIELSHYEDIPHLLHPVVTDPTQAIPILRWAVAEMELRYELFKQYGVKSLATFNKKIRKDNKDARPTLACLADKEEQPGTLPLIVIIIDEMADLMMINKEVEIYIARLAQMARAAGMHLIVATQRPSVDVITGLIKANFPSRISFRVSSKIDSRTILDGAGANQLLGMGDMLFLSPSNSGLKRVHGAYVSEDELDRVVNFVREQKGPDYIDELDEQITQLGSGEAVMGGAVDGGKDLDPMYDQALDFVTNKGAASISMIQRQFRIGYNRAARIVDQMEQEGILGPADVAGKPRKVLVKAYPQEMDE